jgi:hypothetical protein
MNLTPSSAHRWMICTGYPFLLSANKIPYEQCASASEGVIAHGILEQVINGIPLAITADVDMVMGANLLKAALPINLQWIVGGRIVAMHTSDISIKGTVDIYGYDDVEDVVHIFDYKYGHTTVEVFENWQLIVYAIGVKKNLIKVNAGTLFSLTIVQPRAWHEDGVIRNWTITMAELEAYEERVYSAANTAVNPGSRTCVTGRVCKYCPVAHCCEALRHDALYAADNAYAQYEELPNDAIGIELDILRDAAAIIENRLTGLEQDITYRLKKGDQIAGYTLAPGRGTIKWNVPDDEVLALGEIMGVPVSIVKLVTPTQAISAGLDSGLINMYTVKISGALGLSKIKGSLTKLFG